MSKPKRGNDAIPTWSGFNYQGKITLLCSLMEINKLIAKGYRQELLNDCYVEIEKTEDFVLFLQGNVKSLYQVKAYLSKDKTSSFIEAMKKLIEHRSSLNALTADCYICAPRPISDWNDSGNTYKNQIKLFSYNTSPVYVTEVAEKIKIELEETLKYMGIASQMVNDIYLGLCSYLDSKVAKMHNQEAAKRNYNLLFKEMTDFIFTAHTHYVVEQETIQKENIYNHIVGNFKNVINEFCNNECENKQMGTCKKDIYGSCALTTSYDYLLEINIWEYCKYLNPHIITGWDRQLSYVERLREEDFKKLLVPIFYKVSEGILRTDAETIYCETDIFDTVKSKVIPTLLNFDFGLNDISKSISDTLNRIKKNSFLWSSSITGSSITADTKGEKYNTEEDSILYFDKDNEEDSITDNDNYIKIVDSRDFIRQIGGLK
ncbi:MAG: hypothetical protein RR306_05350 [Clostridia bacterium]